MLVTKNGHEKTFTVISFFQLFWLRIFRMIVLVPKSLYFEFDSYPNFVCFSMALKISNNLKSLG